MCEFLFYEYRVVAQLVVFLVWDQEVAGSNPASPTHQRQMMTHSVMVARQNLTLLV